MALSSLSAAAAVSVSPVTPHLACTPEDDTHYAGCNGHLFTVWPYDKLYYVYTSVAGGWEPKAGDAGAIGANTHRRRVIAQLVGPDA
jgi:hypothetical protein